MNLIPLAQLAHGPIVRVVPRGASGETVLLITRDSPWEPRPISEEGKLKTRPQSYTTIVLYKACIRSLLF